MMPLSNITLKTMADPQNPSGQVGEKWVYDDYFYLCKGLS
jgi:hypothetical protein